MKQLIVNDLNHKINVVSNLNACPSECTSNYAPIKVMPHPPHPGTGGGMGREGRDLTTLSMILHAGQYPRSNVVKSPV